MSPQPAIWFGDAARAFERLAPGNDATCAAIARLLGLEWPATIAAKEPSLPEAGDEEAQKQKPFRRDPGRSESPLKPKSLQPIAYEPPSESPVLYGIPSLPKPGAPSLPPAHEPLFKPRWTRDIVALSLATNAADGPVDVRALVETIARGRPVKHIRRQQRPSLYRGVQLLVDIGEGMEPFARDQEQLARQIHDIVGIGSVVEIQFKDCPLRGAGGGALWTWRRYRPPDPGTPVLVLSDLGIGGPRVHPERCRLEELHALARLLAARASPLLAYVPYSPDRWPDGLWRIMTLLQWDRATTVGRVRVAVGAVLAVRR